MKPTHSSRFAAEPLESRIAPALLIHGANYLTSGQSGETSLGENAVTIVKVTSGSALVYFEFGEIVGISVGPNAGLEITGNVFGDIVGNLTAAGRLSDSDGDPANGEDGGVLLPNSIVGIKTSRLGTQNGDIHAILTGGSIAGLSINGEIEGIYAGDGVFRTDSDIALGGVVAFTIGRDIDDVTPGVQSLFDLNPLEPGVQSGLSLAKADAVMLAGASIKNVKIETANELQIFSGSGNPNGSAVAKGGAGGNIENIALTSAFTATGGLSYLIFAGDGASGATGGAGGSVLGVIEKASNGAASIFGGEGGKGSTGIGGAGGSVNKLDLQSDSTSYTVVAGNGGAGIGGGAGGSLLGNNFSGKNPSSGLIVSADFNGDGAADVVVIDSGTGAMVLNENSGDGTAFTQKVQYVDAGMNDITTIDTLGTTPADAVAADIDGDGDLDLIVAYRNSSALGVFLNDGLGDFYDEVVGEITGFTVELGINPSLIAVGDFSGDSRLDVAAVAVGATSSTLVVAVGALDASDKPTFSLRDVTQTFAAPAADIVTAPIAGGLDDLYIGFRTGSIGALVATGQAEGDVFELRKTLGGGNEGISGGIANLDVDSTGQHLLALGSTSKAIELYAIQDDGQLFIEPGPSIVAKAGRPLVARFIANPDPEIADSIGVLFSLSAGSRFDVYDPVEPDADPLTEDAAYETGATSSTAASLKNFALSGDRDDLGVAALGGSLSRFFFNNGLDEFDAFAQPFAGKVVVVQAGDGGEAANLGSVQGKGGAGGSVIGINAEAQEVTVLAGLGGGSQSGPAGAGGSVVNPATFITAGNVSIAPKLLAEVTLTVAAGSGGTASSPGAKASGGAGGSIAGIFASLNEGLISIAAGDGGDGFGGAAGAGGGVKDSTALASAASVSVVAGSGGTALTGKAAGGIGGSISNFKYTLQLDEAAEANERAYTASLIAGDGGGSTFGLGGAGGSIAGVTIFIDPSDVQATAVDSTALVELIAGDGGSGATGGNGGGVQKVKAHVVFDQTTDEGLIVRNFAVARIDGGNGGEGIAGNGGNGGSLGTLLLEGFTGYDDDSVSSEPPILAGAGSGGDGTVKGGAGGAIAGLIAQNVKFNENSDIAATQLFGALIVGGDGGRGGFSDGGKGGDVSGLQIGVRFGSLDVFAGRGGIGGLDVAALAGKGGAGGTVSRSVLGSVTPDSDGVVAVAGEGGGGRTAGGAGGALTGLILNTSQSDTGTAGILYAGDGGAASSAGGKGGKGGDITAISQAKDLNSVINTIEAGNGGEALAGTGGNGGSVANVKVLGFLGRPTSSTDRLGVFDEFGYAQGVFSGRGGAGLVNGIAGSVSQITARQIAAIAASVDVNNLFGIASKVSGVTADLIGYEVTRDNVFENVNGTGGESPSTVEAIDGFILAAAIQNVKVTRPGFVFTA